MAVIRGIVFDKDGTLYDFNATWGAWAYALIQSETNGDAALAGRIADAIEYDLPSRTFLPSSPVIAGTAEEVAEILMPVLGETSRSDLLDRMNAAAAEAPQAEAAPLEAFLTGLRAMGLKLGVATNDSEAPARAHLGASGVTGLFDFIAGYDSGFGGKPAPGQLLAFCDETGLAPETCVMVGDSTHDLRAGRAAGMRTVAVLTGLATAEDLAPLADVVMPSIADLPLWIAAQG